MKMKYTIVTSRTLRISGVLLISLALVNTAARQDDRIPTINSLQEIIQDMELCHEALPHGLPSKASWKKCPRIGMGNDAEGFTAMIPWGQVYVPESGNPATNTRVQIRHLETYYLSKSSGRWHLWNGSYGVTGSAFVEDFVDNLSKPADQRVEPDGSVSVRTGEGYNYHFWTAEGRTEIDPEDIKGVFSTCQARLILHDESLPDDREEARYMMSIGADYWRSLSVDWDQWKTNGDIGIGRFKFVTNDWQAFNMHTLEETELIDNPPPMR